VAAAAAEDVFIRCAANSPERSPERSTISAIRGEPRLHRAVAVAHDHDCRRKQGPAKGVMDGH